MAVEARLPLADIFFDPVSSYVLYCAMLCYTRPSRRGKPGHITVELPAFLFQRGEERPDLGIARFLFATVRMLYFDV